MRSFVLAILSMAITSTPSAAVTLGDAFELTASIKAEVNQRCPEGKQSDLVSLVTALECRRIEMGALLFNIQLTELIRQLMVECIEEVQAGKPFKDCRMAETAYEEKIVLGNEDERAYAKLQAMYEALLRDWPVLRR